MASTHGNGFDYCGNTDYYLHGGGRHGTGFESEFPAVVFVADVFMEGMASAIAIYGVHRLQTMERQVLQSGKLGKYRLIKKLGAGGMGSVYLAEDTLLQRNCALKLLLPNRQNNPQLQARFEREVQVLASISHPNVVQIFDYGHSEGGVFYYAMEYLDGPTLQDLVRTKQKLAPDEVEIIILQIGSALNGVHQNGLIHRDIKPSNVIACNSDKQVVYKLLDFSVVKTTCLDSDDEHLTRDGAIIGTPAFMSPEQASGVSLDVRSDIYSLGAVAYYLLVGEPPFNKNTIIDTLSAHIHEPLVSPRKLRPEEPVGLSDVISRCLAKDPLERFYNVDDLEAFLRQTGVNKAARIAEHD